MPVEILWPISLLVHQVLVSELMLRQYLRILFNFIKSFFSLLYFLLCRFFKILWLIRNGGSYNIFCGVFLIKISIAQSFNLFIEFGVCFC